MSLCASSADAKGVGRWLKMAKVRGLEQVISAMKTGELLHAHCTPTARPLHAHCMREPLSAGGRVEECD